MQSICGEIFFLVFRIDCWFTLEWWEMTLCLLRAAEKRLFSLSTSSIFVICFPCIFCLAINPAYKRSCCLLYCLSLLENSPQKKSLGFINSSFVRGTLRQWKPAPHMWKDTAITPGLSWLVKFSCSLRAWIKESFSLPGRTYSSLDEKCGGSWVLSFMQKMLAFKINPLAWTSLFFTRGLKISSLKTKLW